MVTSILLFMVIVQIQLLTLQAKKKWWINEKQYENRKALRDLIVVDVCISCDDDPFLDSRLRYSSFHHLTDREQKEDLKSMNTQKHVATNIILKLF